MNKEYVVEILDLKKEFNGFWALNGITLSIPKGKFIALLGPNGAGKTTLLEILEGLERPTSGIVKLFGMEWSSKNEIHIKKRIGLSLQETRFIDKLTVLETLRLFASFNAVSKERIFEVMNLLELTEKKDTFTEHLSGGFKQRLALAISILHEPELLFLDEPTTGLDPEARKNIWSILNKLKLEKNKTIILTTHYMEEAEYLSDYIYMINHGRIIAEGTLNQLLNKYGQSVRLVFYYDVKCKITEKKLNNIFKNKSTESYYLDAKNHKIYVYVKQKLNIINVIEYYLKLLKQSHIKIFDFEFHKSNLNDIFLQLSGENLYEDI